MKLERNEEDVKTEENLLFEEKTPVTLLGSGSTTVVETISSLPIYLVY